MQFTRIRVIPGGAQRREGDPAVPPMKRFVP